VSWLFPTHKPECAGCHQNDYKTGPHKKTEVPAKISYTVTELKDCSGSCHEYTDNTFSTIKKSRTGKHQPSSGGW
jgi:hypothetical protein